MAERRFLELGAALAEALGDIAGRRAVDIGCGSGRATRALAALGAEATGVEPDAAAVEKARARDGAAYVHAPAEATGLPADAFDLALFSESLHHIPDRPAALREAARIVRPGGRIAVLEPQAGDPAYEAVRLIDDEAEVYAAAQQAIDAFAAAGAAVRARTLLYATKHRVAEPGEMLAAMVAVDPGRGLAEADRPAFEAAFRAALRRDARGSYLPFWQRLDVLALAEE